MHTLRRLALAGAAVALLGAALSAPVTAAGTGKLTIVQGIPGTRVDLCIGSVEVASAMPYGRVVTKSLPAGAKLVKVFAARAGTCVGSPTYGRARVGLPGGSDKTVVLTRKEPGRVLVFDNRSPSDLTVVPPDGSGWIVVRQASDLGPVAIRAAVNPETFPWMPAADPAWAKGQYFDQSHSIVGSSHLIMATPVDTATPLASTSVYVLKGSLRYEHILVGTSAANARFINLQRPLVAPG